MGLGKVLDSKPPNLPGGSGLGLTLKLAQSLGFRVNPQTFSGVCRPWISARVTQQKPKQQNAGAEAHELSWNR